MADTPKPPSLNELIRAAAGRPVPDPEPEQPKPANHGDWGGGPRGATPPPRPPSIGAAINAAFRRHRDVFAGFRPFDDDE